MSLLSQLESDRRRMLPQVRQMFDDLDNSLADMLDIDSKMLPAEYAGKRKNTPVSRIIKKVQKKFKLDRDQRAISVKFAEVNGTRVVEKSTPERLAAIENYRKQVENGVEELTYDINEVAQYNQLLKFAKAAYFAGKLTPDDFATEPDDE